MRLAVALVVVLAGPRPVAAADCRVAGSPWVEGRVRGAPSRAVDARLGETVEAFLAVPGLLDGRRVVFGEAGRGRRSWAQAGCPKAEVAWRRVEPRAHHLATPAPNADISCYANAVIFGPSHGKWLGFDRLEYHETPLAGGGWARRLTEATPSEGAEWREGDLRRLGTMRLAATMRLGEREWRTPGAEDAPEGQISDRVFRYSLRRDDTFLGWLTSFFNVPYLFGSAGQGRSSQAERRIGADCADVLVAALRLSGRRSLSYSSVNGLVSSLRKVAGPVEVRPCPAAAPPGCAPLRSSLRVGERGEARPGDLLALDYVGGDASLPRPWDHIVALVEDRGPGGGADGVLGPEDIVADSGDGVGLKLAALGEQGHVRVAVLRPR